MSENNDAVRPSDVGSTAPDPRSPNDAEAKDSAPATESSTAQTNPTEPNVVAKKTHTSDPTLEIEGIDFIIHNMYAEAGFTTFRKWFSEDADAMLARVAKHVEQKLYGIISLQLSKHSCVVVCVSEKAIEQFPEGALEG